MMNRRHFLTLATAAAAASHAAAAPPATDQPILSFGLLTDVQYADADPNGERHYRSSPAKLKAAVADLATHKLACSLHLGDLIDHDFKSYATVLPLFAALGHPVHQLMGNHDFSIAEGEKARVAATLGMPHDYYTFRCGAVRFVMLDTNDISAYKYPQGGPQDLAAEAKIKQMTAKAQPWNGALSETQLAWLDRELTAADAAAERVILCGHHPLLPATAEASWNHDEVIALIDRHRCVAAYLNGHNHAGAEEIRNGVPFITFKSILHHPATTAYAIVRLFADRLVIEGRGREASRTLPLARPGN